LDGHRSFRAERFDPPEQVNWYASRFHPLEQSFFAHSVVGAFDIGADQIIIELNSSASIPTK
jgi:hypothetical protein